MAAWKSRVGARAVESVLTVLKKVESWMDHTSCSRHGLQEPMAGAGGVVESIARIFQDMRKSFLNGLEGFAAQWSERKAALIAIEGLALREAAGQVGCSGSGRVLCV